MFYHGKFWGFSINGMVYVFIGSTSPISMCHYLEVCRILRCDPTVRNVCLADMNIIKSPRYGYCKNLNPCIDCRIFMFTKAREFMKKSGSSFIITGEMLGERPMSQKRDAMNIIRT